MGAEGHIPHTLFVQVSIDLHERQATPGEVAHTRDKPTILLARLAWQRLEFGLGVVHGLKLVVLHAATPRVEPPAPRGLVPASSSSHSQPRARAGMVVKELTWAVPSARSALARSAPPRA